MTITDCLKSQKIQTHTFHYVEFPQCNHVFRLLEVSVPMTLNYQTIKEPKMSTNKINHKDDASMIPYNEKYCKILTKCLICSSLNFILDARVKTCEHRGNSGLFHFLDE